MALFMTLLMRDEEDIVDTQIRFHLENGVDHVIVTDNLSQDRSAEIVQSYVQAGVATYIYEEDPAFAQAKWVSHMAGIAHNMGAKWVFHSDADEFWVTHDGRSLAAWFHTQWWPNVVKAYRHDFVCIGESEQPFWERMIYRKTASTNPLGKPLPPKVAHRAAPGLWVTDGNHGVSGFTLKRPKTSNLDVLHFPLRSRAQYFDKIRVGARALEKNKNLPQTTGITWRKQYRELEETGTLAFVDANVLSQSAVEARLASGELTVDRRLHAFMTALT